jgi:hypothetical protein
LLIFHAAAVFFADSNSPGGIGKTRKGELNSSPFLFEGLRSAEGVVAVYDRSSQTTVRSRPNVLTLELPYAYLGRLPTSH